MGIAYLNNGAIEIPNVKAESLDPELIADEARTADGTLRRDVLAVKRTWRLDCIFLTKAQYDAIMDYLDSIMWSGTTFWCDEFTGTAATSSIPVLVSVAKDERVQFTRSDGVWEQQGRHLSLIIKER